MNVYIHCTNTIGQFVVQATNSIYYIKYFVSVEHAVISVVLRIFFYFFYSGEIVIKCNSSQKKINRPLINGQPQKYQCIIGVCDFIGL